MAFNFDQRIDRRHSDSLKWNKYSDQDVLPLWVADTDFRSPECIIEAIKTAPIMAFLVMAGDQRD